MLEHCRLMAIILYTVLDNKLHTIIHARQSDIKSCANTATSTRPLAPTQRENKQQLKGTREKERERERTFRGSGEDGPR